MEFSLIGDADGFPLKLTLSVVNENVTGIYKNVTYGTTMTVRGTMVDNVIYLEGTADHTNYEFQIIAEDENYTGTFGRVGGKREKAYSPINVTILNEKKFCYIDKPFSTKESPSFLTLVVARLDVIYHFNPLSFL